MLWESIANSHWFKRSCLILFLNKIDLFKEKIAGTPITSFGFMDFKGNTSDWQQTGKYLRDKFVSLSRSRSREVYSHFTNATDTDLLKVTMTSVQDMILQKNLQKFILWNLGRFIKHSTVLEWWLILASIPKKKIWSDLDTISPSRKMIHFSGCLSWNIFSRANSIYS